MAASRQLSFLFVCTSGCNLACRYCYMPPTEHTMLSYDDFASIFEKLDGFFPPEDEFNVVFHGGEPLLLGADFYQRAFALLATSPRRIHSIIQTNLLLMDDELLPLFVKNDCTIGTSLDGSETMHDRNRRYRRGGGTYHDVAERIDTLRERDVPCGIIVTLTNANVGSPRELYESLRRFSGAAISFSPMYLPEDPDGLMPGPGGLAVCLTEMYDLWMADEQPLHIVDFENVTNSLLGVARNPRCTFSGRCTSFFLAINAKGDVFPCCDFVGREDLSYGNLLDASAEEVWNSRVREALSHRLDATRDSSSPLYSCSTCEFFDQCHGGCMAKATSPLGNKDHYCADYRLFFSHVRQRLAEVVPD